MEGTIQSLFYEYPLTIDPTFYLVEFAIVGYGIIISYRALYLYAEILQKINVF